MTKILLIIFFARFFSDRELKISSPKVNHSVCCAAYSVAHPYCDTAESFHYNLYRSAFLCSHFSGRIKLQICRNSSCDYDSCVAIFLAVAVQPNQPFLHDYQQDRILAWLEPEKYADDESYQQLNSVMAIGSGQLSGKGYNNDATTSVKNGNFVSNRKQILFLQLSEKN